VVLRTKGTQTWMTNIVQNFVHGGHISLGHLLFEAALMRKDMPACAGRPFVITDEGAPPTYGDMYHLCKLTSEKPVTLTKLPPALFLILAHVIELFAIGSRTPVLKWVIPEPKGTLAILQPGVFHAALNFVANDAAACRSVEKGGLGFKHVHNSMEGMCQQVLEWNLEQAAAPA
jgi:hypothetical protein